MDRDKIIETYVEKLNDECRHRHDKGFMEWSYCNIVDINNMAGYCISFNVNDVEIHHLCDTCRLNLREYKKEVSDNIVLSIQTYEHILSELRELRNIINELKSSK